MTSPASAVRQPAWRLTIGGRDVTRDLIGDALSIVYTDHAHGEADDVEVQLDNSSGRYYGSWAPSKGLALTLHVGYRGEPLVPCGSFEIDEISAEGPPDTVTIKALATGVTPSIRTRRSVAHEGLTLRELAETVATRHGLTVTGTIGHIHLGRITQHDERDLRFLKRIAQDYGYVFAVKGQQLVFHEFAQLDSGASGGAEIPIARTDLTRYVLRDKSVEQYKAAEVRYHDPETKQTVRHVESTSRTTGSTLVVPARTENAADAQARAQAALHQKARREQEGTLSMEGNPRCVSGNRPQLFGFGVFNGLWTIDTSVHSLSKSEGYTTQVEILRRAANTAGAPANV